MAELQREVIRTQRFVADATGFILEAAELALRERDHFRIALSGGNTPRPVYAELAKAALPWDRVRFTFGDERCVAPDDPQSNFRMARETLFEPAEIPEASVLRMRGEDDPQSAAREYEKQLDALAAESSEPIYRHDLILLGIGDDGHTASLFPETEALNERERRVVANFVPKFNSSRLTFTYPVINAARHVCFLVNASKNQQLIERVIAGDEQYPSARVRPTDGGLTFILDLPA